MRRAFLALDFAMICTMLAAVAVTAPIWLPFALWHGLKHGGEFVRERQAEHKRDARGHWSGNP